MPDIVLHPGEQTALRALMAAEPVPGDPFPLRRVLEDLARLIPCDALGVALADSTGLVIDEVTLPRNDAFHSEAGLADCLWLGVRNGPDHVAQLFLDRTRTPFSDRDVAMLQLLAPTLQRLLRERPVPRLPAELTLQERRVLMHVAAGRSNQEIADRLFISPGTVRKHLEHAYRKLGVSNRVAAVATLQGRDQPDLDLKERISRYA